MNISNELIEKYLTGESLDTSTIQAIEEKLRSDEAFTNLFAEKITITKPDDSLLKGIRNAGDSDLQKKVYPQVALAESELTVEGFFEKETSTEQETLEKKVIHRRMAMRFLLTAAAALTIVIAAVLFLIPSKPTDRQITSWFPDNQKQEIILQLKEELAQQGTAFARNETYSELVISLEKSQSGDLEGAKQGLENICREHPEIEIAHFYLAEMLFRLGDKEGGSMILTRLAAQPGAFQTSATMILDEL